MRFLKILPIIAIAFLAACKSTVPQSERLLEERVSITTESSSSVAVEVDFSKPRFLSPEDSAAIFKDLSKYVFDSIILDMSANFLDDFRGGCDGTPSLALCDIHYDKQKIHLNILSQNKKYQFNLNIENGIVTVQKMFFDYDDEKKCAIYVPNTKTTRRRRTLHAIINPYHFRSKTTLMDMIYAILAMNIMRIACLD